MNYKINLSSNNGTINYCNDTVSFTAQGDNDDTRFSLSVEFPDWEDDAYVFLPACAYDGNKFEMVKINYPPAPPQEYCKDNYPPVISDVPKLNVDGSGKIEVASGDMSVPCFGVFFKNIKKAFFLFTEQTCKGKNIGFAVESGRVTIQFPVIRSIRYRLCHLNVQSNDCGISVTKGETISSKILIKEFDCHNMPEFFELFFKNRRCLLSDAPAKNGYTKELWHVMENHFNNDCFFTGEFYYGMHKTRICWQCGWVGGGMSSLPLLKHGNETSRHHAIKTIDYMTSHVAPTGFFYSKIINGSITDDGFGKEHLKDSTLIRKNGDALYFLFKHFDVVEPKESWITVAKGCADAFVKLYERYQDFGMFVNVETGEMQYGGTTSGASAIGALIRAWQYFGNVRYLEIAQLAGEKYYTDFVARGLTYGGPGEAMCAPDSESSYAMVESMMLLYEATREEKWLQYTKDSLHLFSSWVMPYSYVFPKNCEFGRLNINTVGSVFANVQNKHSAPGICTASGDAIYKLYKYTGNVAYLDLLRDIAFFIPQCASTDDRPLYSWRDEPNKLAPGSICERVNTSDWDGDRCVGGVTDSSVWPEVSLLLSFSELIWNEEISKEL